VDTLLLPEERRLKNHRRFECFKISFATARNPWIATAAIIGCSQPVFNHISPNPMAMPPPHTPDSAAGHRESPSKAEGGSQTKPQALIPPPTKTSSPLQGFQREQYVQSFVVAEDSTPEIDGDVKAIAFYLPQFHPIPENDEWWGKGFTEWTNVTKSQPQFAGHHQPQLPGELGFYDLRLSEIRDQQAQLAREHGLHGFCYYYYWFSGRRILERPLQMMLDAGTPDFPFCICWANENWTRRWDGLDQEVLLEQTYDEASDLAFIRDVLPILKDPRYIRIKGAPLLLVYRVDLLPDPVHTSAVWRQACKEAGLGGMAAVRREAHEATRSAAQVRTRRWRGSRRVAPRRAATASEMPLPRCRRSHRYRAADPAGRVARTTADETPAHTKIARPRADHPSGREDAADAPALPPTY
jgi:hypothetical protein